jgi:phage head maturation protease
MIEAIDNNQFIIQASTITEKPTANDGELILTGMASSNSKSLYGEVMSESALQRMCTDAVGLPILYDHEGKMKSIAGVVKNAYLQDNDLYLDFSILPRFQEEIRELIEFGVLLGLSIGGHVSSFDMKNGLVEDITLVEVSLTPVPANRDTHGTVHIKQNMVTGDCLYGVCNTLIKENLKEDEIISQTEKMEEIQRAKPDEEKPVDSSEEKPQEEEKEDDAPLTREDVKEMMDERFAEEKQSIIETVLAEVKDMLNNKGEEEEVKQSAETTPQQPGDVPVDIKVELDSDEIVEKLSAKLFDGLTERRDTSTTKMEQSLKDEPVETEEVKTGMTPEEAAKMLIRSMDETDPITRAINQSLNK